MPLDKRLTPARPNLAAAHLKGQVEAEKFVDGTRMRVAKGRAPLHAAPQTSAERQTELLFGEIFTVYDEKDCWSWGQAETDSYVGYIHSAMLDAAEKPDAHVTAPATALLPACDVKSVLYDLLPMGAQVKIAGRKNGFAELSGGGHVYERHLAPLAEHAPDFVGVAKQFLGVPYVWGGKTVAGMDCSGLIQTALQAAGIAAPRDTDMMEASLGHAVDIADVRRGDLVFWKGHMGVMLNGAILLHANAFHMQVAREPLAEAIARIAPIAGSVTSIKRL